jgi:hypothetical protein
MGDILEAHIVSRGLGIPQRNNTLEEAMVWDFFWGNTALNPRSSAKQQYEGQGGRFRRNF